MEHSVYFNFFFRFEYENFHTNFAAYFLYDFRCLPRWLLQLLKENSWAAESVLCVAWRPGLGCQQSWHVSNGLLPVAIYEGMASLEYQWCPTRPRMTWLHFKCKTNNVIWIHHGDSDKSTLNFVWFFLLILVKFRLNLDIFCLIMA